MHWASRSGANEAQPINYLLGDKGRGFGLPLLHGNTNMQMKQPRETAGRVTSKLGLLAILQDKKTAQSSFHPLTSASKSKFLVGLLGFFSFSFLFFFFLMAFIPSSPVTVLIFPPGPDPSPTSMCTWVVLPASGLSLSHLAAWYPAGALFSFR